MSSSTENESDWPSNLTGPDLSSILQKIEPTNESPYNADVNSQIDSDLEYAFFLQHYMPFNETDANRLSVSSNDPSVDSLVIPDLGLDDEDDESIDENILEMLDLTTIQREQLMDLMRNDSVNYSVPGLKRNQISRLQKPCTVNINTDDNCGVCMAEFMIGEKKRTLKCKHFFHVDCIDQWLRKTALCPLCRNQVVAPKRVRLPKCTIL